MDHKVYFWIQSIVYTLYLTGLESFSQVNILILSPGLVDIPDLLGPVLLLLACSTISGFTTSVCHKMLQHLLSSIAILRWFLLAELPVLSLYPKQQYLLSCDVSFAGFAGSPCSSQFWLLLFLGHLCFSFLCLFFSFPRWSWLKT